MASNPASIPNPAKVAEEQAACFEWKRKGLSVRAISQRVGLPRSSLKRGNWSSLKRGNWSRRGCCRCDRFSGRFRRVLGVRHPQPGSRRSARSAARTNGLDAGEDGAILIQPGAGSRRCVVVGFRPHGWPKIRQAGPGVGLPVIPSPREWRHEAVRLQQGGINQAGDHATTGWES